LTQSQLRKANQNGWLYATGEPIEDKKGEASGSYWWLFKYVNATQTFKSPSHPTEFLSCPNFFDNPDFIGRSYGYKSPSFWRFRARQVLNKALHEIPNKL